MLPAPGAYNTHTCIDKKLHRQKRKVVSQAFSEGAIRAFEPAMVKNINVFIDELVQHCKERSGEDGWSQPLNMSTVTQYLAMDVMGEFSFGRNFEMQTKQTNRFLVDAIKASSRVAGVYAQYPRLKDIGVERWLKKGNWTRAKFGMLMKAMVEKRISQGAGASHDLFSFIINSQDPETGQKFTLDEIWAESRLFIIAGMLTVIGPTLWIIITDSTRVGYNSYLHVCNFLYLSRNPECREKLTKAIRETFASASEICTGPRLYSCHYLRACIDEAMRMSPPIGTALWREVCDSGIIIDGEWIPPRVDVGSSLYSIHHNEDYFDDPWTYNPDRWMETGTPYAPRHIQQLAFNPFSLGSRKCVAQTMSYTEISITLAKALWYFDLRIPTGPLSKIGAGIEGASKGRHRPHEFQLWEHFTSHHDGPFLELRPGTKLVG